MTRSIFVTAARVFAGGALCLVPVLASAQSGISTTVSTSSAVVAPASLTHDLRSGPQQDRAGITRVVESSVSATEAAPQDVLRRNQGPDVALMVVGGAALIAGLVVGGDSGQLIAITGAVLGLIGLFRYVR